MVGDGSVLRVFAENDGEVTRAWVEEVSVFAPAEALRRVAVLIDGLGVARGRVLPDVTVGAVEVETA